MNLTTSQKERKIIRMNLWNWPPVNFIRIWFLFDRRKPHEFDRRQEERCEHERTYEIDHRSKPCEFDGRKPHEFDHRSKRAMRPRTKLWKCSPVNFIWSWKPLEFDHRSKRSMRPRMELWKCSPVNLIWSWPTQFSWVCPPVKKSAAEHEQSANLMSLTTGQEERCETYENDINFTRSWPRQTS